MTKRNPRDPIAEEDWYAEDPDEYENEREDAFLRRHRIQDRISRWYAAEYNEPGAEEALDRDLRWGPRRPRRLRRPRRNPGGDLTPGIVDRYAAFHGVEPSKYKDTRLWMPGKVTLVGQCIDCGYSITDRRSNKSGRYVHDHEGRVKLYARANPGDPVSKTMTPPKQVFVLGNWLGCTFKDRDGEHEINGSSTIKACTDNGKRLFAVHVTKGCLYVISGGSFKITDWMYD
jgi:hypothetical protein